MSIAWVLSLLLALPQVKMKERREGGEIERGIWRKRMESKREKKRRRKIGRGESTGGEARSEEAGEGMKERRKFGWERGEVGIKEAGRRKKKAGIGRKEVKRYIGADLMIN